jgi:hypothetical protein
VEASIARVDAQDAGWVRPPFAVQPEGMFDSLDARVHGEQVGHVTSSEEKRHDVFMWRMVAYSHRS